MIEFPDKYLSLNDKLKTSYIKVLQDYYQKLCESFETDDIVKIVDKISDSKNQSLKKMLIILKKHIKNS